MASSVGAGFEALVGNTALIRLDGVSRLTGCKIFGKCEFLNPGGSIKDRAALAMMNEIAQRLKECPDKQPVIVEGTAGNTGIALAHICAQRGYKAVFTVPPKTSLEKIARLRALRAEVVVCADAAPGSDEHFQLRAAKIAQERNGFHLNQFDNPANRNAHYTTGREIWEQTGRKCDAVAFAVGTGGTLTGVSSFLKEQDPSIRVYMVDTPGQAVKFAPPPPTTGEDIKHDSKKELVPTMRTPEEKAAHFGGSSVLEGVGSSLLYENLLPARVDETIVYEDEAAIAAAHHCLLSDGLFVGGSTGANILGAYVAALKLGPGHTVVTVLCEGGANTQSKLFNDEWLAEKGYDVRCGSTAAELEQHFRRTAELNMAKNLTDEQPLSQ